MNLPNIPTDNLYKFIAISGLIFFFASIVFPAIESDKIKQQLIQLETEQAILLQEQNFLLAELKARTKPYSEQKSEAKLKEAIKLSKKTAELEGKVMRNLYLSARLKLINRLSVIGFGVGLFLTGLGFFFWYTKVQKYQDKIIKKELSGA